MLQLFNFEKNDYKAAEYNWIEDAERLNASSIYLSESAVVRRHSLKRRIDCQKEF